MPNSSEPLSYPSHYPPTDKWKKFFIGVRWLGPDLRFFAQLKQCQANRTTEQMTAWGGGLRQQVAEQISEFVAKRLKWASPIFLPADHLAVVFNGPKFDMYDDFVFEDVIENLQNTYKVKLDLSKVKLPVATLGAFVDLVIEAIEKA